MRREYGEAALSVTVLNYNYGHYLGQCLDSILAQSYADFDLVVIDDCSQDNSISVIKPYLDDPRVRLIAHGRNAGFVNSLIEGSEASTSPYLTVVSADDLILSASAFEKQMSLLESHPGTSFCYGSWARVNPKTEVVDRVMPFSEDHVWSGEKAFQKLCTDFHVLHTGTIIRRTAYEAVGGYDRSYRYAIDSAMWPALCGVGEVAFVADALYGYRTHMASMSRHPEAARNTTKELVRAIESGFASLPDGSVKSDRRLRRQARQAALATVPSMQVFDGKALDGWRTLASAVRFSPAETLFQRRVIDLAARTVLGARGFNLLRGLVRGR